MPRLHTRTIAARGAATRRCECPESNPDCMHPTCPRQQTNRHHVLQMLRALGFDPATVLSAELEPRMITVQTMEGGSPPVQRFHRVPL